MIYISNSNNPFINLSLEHQLFQNTATPALFLYQNNSAVIIGRAQNPWVECDLTFLKEQNIDLVRRQSGGGTVFHDRGNLNFTFFCDKNNYDKNLNLSLIIKALAQLNIEVNMNDRHDLILNGKKISGSAFRETRTHTFHHCTLLIDSNLDLLRRSLKAPAYDIKSKGVPSVRSSVINLKEVYKDANKDTIINAIIKTFAAHYHLNDEKVLINEAEVEEKILQLYQSDAWRLNRTLPFTETIRHDDNTTSTIEIESGIITHIESSRIELLKWLHQPYADFYYERAQCKQI